MSSYIKTLQREWEELAEEDPLWAILSASDKRGRKWGLEEFFGTGSKHIGTTMEYVRSLGMNVGRKLALDFGCGVGRLTKPLSGYFEAVYGVDIAPSMIRLAKQYSRPEERCSYFLNEKDDLSIFDDNIFNFIYTNITLQHIAPKYSIKYISEFLRILAPGGVLIFQLPSEPSTLTGKIKSWLRLFVPPPLLRAYNKMRFGFDMRMEMHGINREKIVRLLRKHKVKILDIKEVKRAGNQWIDFVYAVAKSP